jgi:hypothetical protein
MISHPVLYLARFQILNLFWISCDIPEIQGCESITSTSGVECVQRGDVGIESAR